MRMGIGALVVLGLLLSAPARAQSAPNESAAEPNQSALEQISRPHASYFVPPVAVDHEATIVWSFGAGERRMVRSGDWLRSEGVLNGRQGVEIQNIVTGAEYMYGGPAGGPPDFAQLQVNPAPYVRTRRNTGRVERHAGEACVMWEWTDRPDDHTIDLSCVTADGIELWRGSQFRGEVRESFRAVRVERRRVRADEVHLPREILDWNAWMARAPAAANPPGDYEQRSEFDIGGNSITRRRNGWTLTRGRRGAHADGVTFGNGLLNLSYTVQGGVARYLTIRLTTEPPEIMVGGWPQPMDVPAEIIAGESCQWLQISLMSHAVHNQCRTADGIVLADNYLGDGVRGGPSVRSRAVRFRRTPQRAADMALPGDVFRGWD